MFIIVYKLTEFSRYLSMISRQSDHKFRLDRLAYICIIREKKKDTATMSLLNTKFKNILLALPCSNTLDGKSPDDVKTLNLEANIVICSEIDNLPKSIVINSEEDYGFVRTLRNRLDALIMQGAGGITSAMQESSKLSVDELLSKFNDYYIIFTKAMTKYNKSMLANDADTKTLIRYLLWNRYYSSVDKVKILSELADKGFLYRLEIQGSVYYQVSGIDVSVGTNEYTDKGNRIMAKTIGRQLFNVYVSFEHDEEFKRRFPDIHAKLSAPAIQMFETDFSRTGKNSANPISLSFREKMFIEDKYTIEA